MDDETIGQYKNLEEYYWWFLGRRKVIKNFLSRYFSIGDRRTILDWGCGPCGNFPMLEKFGTVFGVDESEESVKQCRLRGYQNIIKAARLEDFKTDKKFDLITNFDVLEHIKDDENYLRGLGGILSDAGFILVTVPAYQFLWSELDEKLGHARRYSRKDLKNKFSNNGYEVVNASYFIAFHALPIIIYRFFGKLTGRSKTPQLSFVEFPRSVNYIFTKIVELEAWLMNFFNLPFGTSIILLARRKKRV